MAATAYDKDLGKEVHTDALTKSQTSEEGQIVTQYDDGMRPGLMTRLGLTPDSFRKRTLADKHNQLNKTLKGRHLSMIAIGGSIGYALCHLCTTVMR